MFEKIISLGRRIRYHIRYSCDYDFRQLEDAQEIYRLEDLIRSAPRQESEQYKNRLQQLRNKSPFARKKS